MDIRTILVPFDFSEPATRALGWGRTLAERFGSALHLLHVVPNPNAPAAYLPFAGEMPAAFYVPAGAVESYMKEADDQLERVLSSADREAFRARAFVVAGDARMEILEHAAQERVDLIVMGTHGRTGASHLLLGSVAERVVRAAPCPVLTVR
jgi:universal stress protein A